MNKPKVRLSASKIKTLDTVKDKAIKKWGQLDGVIANAGGVKKTHKWDLSLIHI